jgi:hypothetical protein
MSRAAGEQLHLLFGSDDPDLTADPAARPAADPPGTEHDSGAPMSLSASREVIERLEVVVQHYRAGEEEGRYSEGITKFVKKVVRILASCVGEGGVAELEKSTSTISFPGSRRAMPSGRSILRPIERGCSIAFSAARTSWARCD